MLIKSISLAHLKICSFCGAKQFAYAQRCVRQTESHILTYFVIGSIIVAVCIWLLLNAHYVEAALSLEIDAQKAINN